MVELNFSAIIAGELHIPIRLGPGIATAHDHPLKGQGGGGQKKLHFRQQKEWCNLHNSVITTKLRFTQLQILICHTGPARMMSLTNSDQKE